LIEYSKSEHYIFDSSIYKFLFFNLFYRLRMTNVDPEKRPTAWEILQDPIFNDN